MLELRFPAGVQETLDGQLDGLAERIEVLPDRVLLYADDGEAAAAAAHERGLQPETRPRPALDARGRLPAADRPQSLDRVGARRRAARRSTAHRSVRAPRALQYRRDVYRRTWRIVLGSFLTPVLFLPAMGVGLGTLVDQADDAPRSAGVSYLAVPRARPAGRAGDADGRVRGDLAVLGGFNWHRTLPRDARDAARRRATSSSATSPGSRSG